MQTGEPHRDLAELPVKRLAAELGDLADLAVIIQQLDLVIGVDTAVVHLAGALGRPVWTLLSHLADWRFMLEGETTPWYPTMRLFRQSQAGDWGDVMERVARALTQHQWKESA